MLVRTSAVIATLLALAGCASDGTAPLVPEGLPALTAREIATLNATVGNIAVSYEARDLTAFEGLFDPALFRFVFDPVDVVEDPDIPPFWGWSSERVATTNLFQAGDVTGISCEITPLAPPRRAEEGDDPPQTGSVLLHAGYEIEVEMEVAGEPLILLAVGQADFFLLPEPAPSGNAPDLADVEWKVVEWRDIRILGGATQDMTWGKIKHRFR